MEILELIAALAMRYKEKMGNAPAKTKLLKLAYLAEIYYLRLTRERLTSQEWVLWKYGPYFWNYNELISNERVFEYHDQTDDFYLIRVQDDFDIRDFSLNENTALFSALEHATEDLNEILDFVYFDTEPMMVAKARGEILDYSSVKPKEYYSVKHFRVSTKQGKNIIKRIKNWESERKK